MTAPADDVRVVSSQRLFTGRVIALELDSVVEPGGVDEVPREIVRQSGSVAVLPVFDDGRMLLVRQYRYAVRERLWELPAGRLDGGESPETGARRELEEEAGLVAERLEPISFFYTTPGFCDERMTIFRATGLRQVPPRPEPEERIEIATFTRDAVQSMIASGDVREGKTLVALLLEMGRR